MHFVVARYLLLLCGFTCVVAIALLPDAIARSAGLCLLNLCTHFVGLRFFAEQRAERYRMLCRRVGVPPRRLPTISWQIHARVSAFTIAWVAVGVGVMLIPSAEGRVLGLFLEALLAAPAIRWMGQLACRDAFMQAAYAGLEVSTHVAEPQ